MNSKIVDGIRLVKIPAGYDPASPIFQAPPEGLDASWTHGAIVGGLGWYTAQADVARSYRVAADALVDQALAAQNSWEVVYPAIFLYRHALEVTLKALFPDERKVHELDKLIEETMVILSGVLQASDTKWVRDRLYEFHSMDPRSTAFRYAVARKSGVNSLRDDGEFWVDLRHLKQTMEVLLSLLEVLVWGNKGNSASVGC